MNRPATPQRAAALALEVFQPQPNVLYRLETAAQLAGVSRRSVLIYCRAGLVQPVFQGPYGVLAFTEEAIQTIRRIKQLQSECGFDLAGIKLLFDLADEVARLRAELRFWRGQ